MKIAYAVHGYGRGHATRALAVLPELARRHDLLILAGGDAYHALHEDYPLVRLPVLRYALDARGRRSKLATLRRSLPAVLDLKLGGAGVDMVCRVLEEYQPDAVVSDSEAWTHHACRRLGRGRISFDHFAVLSECRWPMGWRDRVTCRFECRVYRMLMGRAQRYVAASFYAPPPRHDRVRVVGPVLRDLVRRTVPTAGEHLLVYLSNGDHHFTPKLRAALAASPCPVRVYGPSREGQDGAITFRPLGNEPFVRDLASCRAVFATAGNQLISEAVHFRKPMLIMPEDSLEQRLNARMIQHLGFGRAIRRQGLTAETLRRFLDEGNDFRSALDQATQPDGAAEAVRTIEQYAQELTP